MMRAFYNGAGTRGSSGRFMRGQPTRHWSGVRGLARPKSGGKASFQPKRALWLITFSDLMTLMLALFVLIFTMSSMESSMLEGISRGVGKDAIQSRGLGRIQDNIQLASRMLNNPAKAVREEPLLRDLLFKDFRLPKPLAVGTLQENIKILEREQGVAIVLTDALLFDAGSVHLQENGRAVLQMLAPLVKAYGKDVFISGHGAGKEGVGQQASAPGSYWLSAQRALTVLEYCIAQGAEPHLLSFAGYGEDRPMVGLTGQTNASGTDFNRRVEIIFKTGRWNGR